jgi:predicted nuclease of predicted toxin-antitoxin system
MKFLFDQSADFRLIPHLQNLGHDVQAISRNFPHGLPDEDVLAIARKGQRILIVADRDFGALIFQQERAHAGVIFFRLPGAGLQTKSNTSILCSANTPTILSAANSWW